VVNGQIAMTVPVTSGEVNGTVGLYVGLGGDITVAGLMLAGDSITDAPGAAPVSK
jgi:hypothetical protein